MPLKTSQIFNTNRSLAPDKRYKLFLKNKKSQLSLFFLKSRGEDYDISPQFRTQMGDGYDFFASVRDGVSIQHAFRLTNLVVVVVLVLVLAAKAP